MGFGKLIRPRFERRLKDAFERFEMLKQIGREKLIYPTYRVLVAPDASAFIKLRTEGGKRQFTTWFVVSSKADCSVDWARYGEPEDMLTEKGTEFPVCHLWLSDRDHDRWWEEMDDSFAKALEPVGGYRTPHAFTMSHRKRRRWIHDHANLYPDVEKMSAAEELLLPLVDQMIECILEYGVPYVQSVADGTHTTTWPRPTPPRALDYLG